MLANLATFIHANGRRVLLVAVLAAAIAGAFGFGVAKHMSPYGADDPATQSVQATNRFEAAARPQDRPRDRGDRQRRRRSQPRGAAARRAGRRPAARRAATSRAPSASMRPTTRRWSRATGARPTWSRTSSRGRTRSWRTPRSGSRIGSPGSATCGSAASRSPTRRPTRRSAMTSRAPSCSRSRSSSCCRCCSSARWSRRCCRRCSAALAIVATFFVLRIVASFADLSVFALNLVTGLGLGLAIDYSLFMVSRYREEAATSGLRPRGAAPHARDRRAHDPVQLADGRRRGRVAGDLPAAVPVLDGNRRRASSRCVAATLALWCCRRCWRARAADQRARAQAAAARRGPRRAPGAERRLVPAVAVRDAPAGADRRRSARRS